MMAQTVWKDAPWVKFGPYLAIGYFIRVYGGWLL